MLSQGRPEIKNPGKSQFNFFFNFLKFKKILTLFSETSLLQLLYMNIQL